MHTHTILHIILMCIFIPALAHISIFSLVPERARACACTEHTSPPTNPIVELNKIGVSILWRKTSKIISVLLHLNKL